MNERRMSDDERYLTETHFDERKYYTVQIGTDGLTVYSECCGDTMSAETARKVHEALGRWLAAQVVDAGYEEAG